MKKKKPVKRNRISNFVEVTVDNYGDEEFKSHFRMNKKTANKMIEMLEQSNYIPRHSDGREKVSAKRAFLLALWYLSNDETFRQISDRFNVSFSSAHRCLNRVLNFLISIKSQIIKWPNTTDEISKVNQGFMEKCGINNIIGVIDGSHIEINKPKENQDAYINRKGYHSLLLQGIVDHKRKFIDVFCGEPGSMHDARLFRKSGIYRKITEDPTFLGNGFLLGDTAYPNTSWLVTPYKENPRLTENQKTFNYRISVARVVVENSFGLLKGRFRRLKKLENFDLQFCSKIVLCACILHNICLNEKDFIDTESTDFNQPSNQPDQSGTNSTIPNITGNRQQLIFNEMFNV
ncbi:putative nuclease HARBI1 isoform X2 [Anoplophora glabripennis]|nr:putative nuclease HARBI1 isoform X2 [Anoplophora glabripennis]